MRIEPLGDRAFILRDLDEAAWRVAEALNGAAIVGLEEAIASYDTVGVYGDVDSDLLSRAVKDLPSIQRRSVHCIPVCYEMGEDIDVVAERLAITTEELIETHLSVEYTCYALGFCPGFAYLGYLPDALANVPRRASPRVRVEPGSLAMTGRQTAIYPLPRPGGWSLIGRTPLVLVDVADGYFPIRAGDQVRFSRIDDAEFRALEGARL